MRSEGLSNYQDNTPPVIQNVSLVKHGTEEGIGNTPYGQIDILVDAYDPVTGTTANGTEEFRCGIYKLSIEFRTEDDQLIDEATIDFHQYDESPSCEVSECYAAGSNTAHFRYKASNHPFQAPYSRYWNTRQKKSAAFNVNSHTYDESLFPDGEIKIRVIAEDIKGNRTVYDVNSDDLNPPTNEYFIQVNDGYETKQYKHGEIAWYLMEENKVLHLDLVDKNGNTLTGVTWTPQVISKKSTGYRHVMNKVSSTPKGTTITAEYQGEKFSLFLVDGKAEIDELSFSGDGLHSTFSATIVITESEYNKYEHNYGLAADATEGRLATKIMYDTPHWKKEKRAYPVCYKKGSNISVSPKLRFSPSAPPFSSVKVKADANDQLQLIAFDYNLHGKTAAQNFNQSVRNTFYSYDPFTINWGVSINGEAWNNAGITNNRIYLLMDTPLEMPNEVVVDFSYQKLVDKTIESQEDFLSELWSVIETKAISFIYGTESKKLKYYGDPFTGNIHADLLLTNGDGQCTSWQGLVAKSLKLQGINAEELTVVATNNNEELLVKNFKFGTPIGDNFSDNNIIYTHQNITHTNWPKGKEEINNFNTDGSYNWLYEEVTDIQGLKGQSNENPIAYFPNHRVVKVGNKIYDPSYGTLYNSSDSSFVGALKSMQDNAIEGFYLIRNELKDENKLHVDLNNDGDSTDNQVEVITFRIRKPNTHLTELKQK